MENQAKYSSIIKSGCRTFRYNFEEEEVEHVLTEPYMREGDVVILGAIKVDMVMWEFCKDVFVKLYSEYLEHQKEG